MKVLLLFRSRIKGGKSIEGLFTNLSAFAPKDIHIDIWEMQPFKSFFSKFFALRKCSSDIFHITGDISYTACWLIGRKVMLTIHDIGRYKELRGLKKFVFGLVWIQLPCIVAKKIITVSRYTADDIISNFSCIPESKIVVIENGYNPGFTPKQKQFNSKHPRILHVGTAPHKNLSTVISAVQDISATLVIIGPLSAEQLNQLDRCGVKYENYFDLDQQSLQVQYEGADIVVFVSIHEGFGMPIIEAQAVGRPVIASRMAAIPEVAGNGVAYVNNPFDARELTTTIIQIMNDIEYREELIRKGFNNVAKYSYTKMASSYMDLYRRIATA
jgi:glycosyltransferase involved in cell wall biosynthesis